MVATDRVRKLTVGDLAMNLTGITLFGVVAAARLTVRDRRARLTPIP